MIADVAVPFTQTGLVLLAIAVLGRLARAAGLAPLPVPLAVGLLVARGGPLPDGLSPPAGVLSVATPLAAAVLLLCLGLEHTRADRISVLRGSAPLGAVDAAANFIPGAATGLLLGWDGPAALLLGGATWASSSGVAGHLLGALDRIGNRETPTVLRLLTLEHLAMAGFLPVSAALLTAGGTGQNVAAVLASGAAVLGAAWAVRAHGPTVRRAVFGSSGGPGRRARDPDEVLLPLIGTALLAAGLLAELQVAALAGAYLAGFVLAGPVTAAEPARAALPVLRQASQTAALFVFGASIDTGGLSARLVAATGALAIVTTGTKLGTGWWAARAIGVAPAGRWRAGATMTGRGEFAVALGVVGTMAGSEPELAPTVALYVLLTCVAASRLARGAGTAHPRWPDSPPDEAVEP